MQAFGLASGWQAGVLGSGHLPDAVSPSHRRHHASCRRSDSHGGVSRSGRQAKHVRPPGAVTHLKYRTVLLGDIKGQDQSVNNNPYRISSNEIQHRIYWAGGLAYSGSACSPGSLLDVTVCRHGADGRQPVAEPRRCGGLGSPWPKQAISASSLAIWRKDVWAGGCRVAGEQDPGSGKVDRDAAGGVAGHGHDDGAPAEGEFVTVSEFAVDPDPCRWCSWQLAADLVEEGPFPVGQVWGRPGCPAAQERDVGVVGAHRDVAPGGDLGGGAGVVGVEMGEQQPSQVRGVMAEGAEGRGDQRGGVGTLVSMRVRPSGSWRR